MFFFVTPSKKSEKRIVATFKLSFLRLGSTKQNEIRKKSTKQTHHSIIHQIPQKFHSGTDIRLLFTWSPDRAWWKDFFMLLVGRKQIHLTVTTLDMKRPTILTISLGMFDSISRAAIFLFRLFSNVRSGEVKCWYWAQNVFFLQHE